MRTNWSGHVTFSAVELAEPSSDAELRELVARSNRIRAVGSGHSFNDIADTEGVHVSLARMPAEVDIDADRAVARVPSGMRFGEAARLLDQAGWAVHNLASLGHIAVGGTVATGTHGSGDRNPTLSAMVRGLRVVRADGSVDEVSDAASLAAEVVALGATGVVTHLDLAIEPTFEVAQYWFEGVSHAALLESFDEAFGSAYSVSFFTTWDGTLTGRLLLKRRLDTEGPWLGDDTLDGTLARRLHHPVPGIDPAHCTEQLGVPGRWHERLPHFRLDHTPSAGDELQTEYLIPRTEAVAALRDLEGLAPRIHPLLMVSEIRTMAADDLWLSGAYGRDTVGIHLTWERRPEVLELLSDLDTVLAARGGRPHWGKLYWAAPDDLRSRYPRFGEFAAHARRMDPQGTFRNRMLDELLGPI